jgi:hypothetical protein
MSSIIIVPVPVRLAAAPPAAQKAAQLNAFAS